MKIGGALWSVAKFAVLAAIVVTAVSWYHSRNMPKGQAPELVAPDINGLPVSLQKMTEKGPVLIYFWATWCGYCRVVSPAVSNLSGDHQVISIALQSGTPEEVATYQQKHNLKFRTINDPAGALSAGWGLQVTPSIAIVDTEGNVSAVTSGMTSEWGLKARLWWAD
ncbi:protein disulfide oxidoreductase [Microbulbifer hydrolyticus]|uniref:Redoxin domain-containing protein n=1 Tax=Microbulbifer hydrolyticus TaxID=48074 RepID=A0A6P1TCT1_9GAMM|nr:protein disulfide oxidoreductase [Microbulbifer hydrolyticus]MBB5212124.1 thiol-disulfide isomerase/thioredoxin [Microbulbifer hydrolyticus]QHQ39797.1 redoxin domain-containing protein [Microbulbifer hydrolyticus]